MRETNKARQAFEDYFGMGPGRSLAKLQRKYSKAKTASSPSRHLATLQKWSTAHGWVKRVAEREAGIAAKTLEVITEEATKSGYALFQKRIADLNKVGELLFEEIMTEDKRWLPDVKQLGVGKDAERVEIVRFNAPLIAQYREALEDIAEEMGEREPSSKTEQPDQEPTRSFSIPAHLLGPDYFETYRLIREMAYTEWVFSGGRGGLKSSETSLFCIEILVNNPSLHMLATRQVGNTLRDSVFSQLRWAIIELGLEDKFRHTLNPLEIEYLPTGQKIYFRGGDDPIKIKSIKPPFGYIGILWFEELDQFKGPEPVRSIEQSAIRGGDLAYIFKTFNPPRTANSWANKYIQIPKATQYRKSFNYLAVPRDWLGKTFLEEAEHLKVVNPGAYEHEYMGVANGTGGLVFENVKIRAITDAEIAQFDRLLHGMDFGFFPDPLSAGKMHYDAARMILYIFDEYHAHKQSNKTVYEALFGKKDKKGTVLEAGKGWDPNALLIADNAEPKSIADLREFGANVRGAEKGPDSVTYSMKWLQSLAAIVIDNQRCPHHAEEFLNYELEKDKNGEFISAYPDKNNHAIDDVRYAANLIWRVRGQ